MDLKLQFDGIQDFDFLEKDYGFKCTKTEPWLIKHVSDVVFVDILFDGYRSYELGCELGRNDDFEGSLERPFDLGEIVKYKEPEKDIPTGFQVTNKESLKRCCGLLADQLKVYAHEFLTGSMDAFTLLTDFRNRECEEYAVKRDLGFMRSQLDAAWQNRDYKKVIKLLFPFKEKLKQSELKKLEYALKKGRR